MKTPRQTPPQQGEVMRILQTAIGHIEAGRLDAAEDALLAHGKIALKNPVGWNVLGDIHLKSDRARDALKAFDRALKIAPNFPEAHCNRGVALQEMGRLEEALRAEDRALRCRKGYPMASFNRGNVLRDMGRLEEALAAYDMALATQSDFAEALLNRGLTRMNLDQPALAMTDFRAALVHNPDSVGAMIGRAAAYQRLDKVGDALPAIDQALAREPDNEKALLLKGELLVTAEEFDEALEVLDSAAAAWPDSFGAHLARAGVLMRLARYDDALAACDRAIELQPRAASAFVTRSLVLGNVGRFDEQADALKRAEKLGASGAGFVHSNAQIRAERGDYAGAIAAYREAIELEPDAYQTHHNLAFAYFTTGLLEEAWPEHEWRLRSHRHPASIHGDKAPKWQGEDLSGKKILVYCEQGHGDTIQFLRFLEPLRESGGAVTFIAPQPLVGLFKENLPWLAIGDRAGLGVEYDFQISLMSLPDVYRTTLATLPMAVPYLRPAANYVDKWRERLGEDGFRVGLVWQGNPKYGADFHRSIKLEQYAPLAQIDGVRLISLQVFHGLDQLDALPPGMKIERLGEEITNNPSGYREVAGVLANLDLIVTSDTGPAHLAGAMARPTFVALRDNPDWRWMRDRDDSPWYPTMRLFRQRTRGDWSSVFEEIAAALAERVALSGGNGASR
ncbi:MAG: tetratricopeptide repeat protein [Alphaproteobacteria bacterium]